MKILFIGHLPIGTAAFYRIFETAKALKGKGYGVKLLIRTNSLDQKNKTENIEGIDISYWNEPFEYLFLLNSFQVIKHCKDVDVIYLDKTNPFSATSTLIARFLSRKPLITDLEDWDGIGGHASMVQKRLIEKFAMTFFEEVVPRKSECVIVVSKYLYKRVVAMGIPEDRIYYVPNGVDLHLFNPSITNGDRVRARYGLLKDPVIVSSGIFAEHELIILKLIIKIMFFLVKEIPNAKLLLVGAGDAIEGAKKSVKTLNLDSNVIFTGYVLHTEVPAYIAAADVALYVLDENFHYYSCSPKTIPEFMAMKKPIVATEIGEICEELKNGAGMLVKGLDPKCYADVLVRILADRKLSKKYAKSAKSRASEYSMEKMAERVERACEKALEMHNKRKGRLFHAR